MMEEDTMMQEGQELPELEEYTEEQESAPEEPQPEQDEAQDAAGVDAQEDAQELPELAPMEQQTPPEAAPQPDPMSEAMALLGVDSAAAAMERIEQIAVSQLMEQGAPEAIAREMVAMRRRMQGSGAYRARDEPAVRAPQTQPAPEVARPNMDKLGRQIEYIRDKTGVDMLEVVKADPAMLAEIDKYSRGQGGYDMMAAYDAHRRARTANRAKVPATVGHGGGQTGAGKRDVAKMSAAELEALEERALRGEKIAL